jgi:uncharacterized protein (TIGR02594 family)
VQKEALMADTRWIKLTGIYRLRKEPDPDATKLDTCTAGDVGNVISEKEEWLEVIIRRFGGTYATGWIPKAKVADLDGPPPRSEVDATQFIKNCVDAELWLNRKPEAAPYFVVADFLIAIALIESGMANPAPSQGDDREGPFRISVNQWGTFVNGLGKGMFTVQDRSDYLDQCYGAAAICHMLTKELSVAFADEGNVGDPFIPSYVEVFLAYICGAPSVIAMHRAKTENSGEKPVEAILLANGWTAEAANKLFDERKEFLKINATERENVQGAYAKVEKRLNAEFKTVLKLFKDLAPEDLPIFETAGGGGWMQEAKLQEEFWRSSTVSEGEGTGKARVIEYFKSIGVNTDEVLHWCGAFAGHCMTKAALGGQIVKDPAMASSWRQFGQKLNLGASSFPEGAVVVLAPDKNSNTSGHVGFYVRHLSGPSKLQVELLGGNQSDRVKRSAFSTSKIVDVRWPMGVTADSNPDQGPQPSTDALQALLDEISVHESGGNYEAYFRKANNTTIKFTTKTINEVIAWQKQYVRDGSPSSAVGRYQIIRTTLQGLQSDMGLSGSTLFDKNTQDRMAKQLLVQAKLKVYLTGKISMTEFGKRIARVWASLPVLADTQGAHRAIIRGQSYYAGDGLNKAGAKPARIEQLLQDLV